MIGWYSVMIIITIGKKPMPNNTDANSQYNRANIAGLISVSRQDGMDTEPHDSSLSRVRHRVTRTAETVIRTARTQISRLHHSFFRPAAAAQTTQDRNSSNSTHSINNAEESPYRTPPTARVTRQRALSIEQNEAISPQQRRNNR